MVAPKLSAREQELISLTTEEREDAKQKLNAAQADWAAKKKRHRLLMAVYDKTEALGLDENVDMAEQPAHIRAWLQEEASE